jgi:hypothetical protein
MPRHKGRGAGGGKLPQRHPNEGKAPNGTPTHSAEGRATRQSGVKGADLNARPRFDVFDDGDNTLLAYDVSAKTAAELLGGVTAKDVEYFVAKHGAIAVNELSCSATTEDSR